MSGAKNTGESRWEVVIGRVLSGLVVTFLLVASAAPKLVLHSSATESFERFGFDVGVTVPIGVMEASIAILYLIPRTSILGAILMTGLLGGATVTQLRVEDPWFVFPLVIGGMAWLGLYLREPRLRALIPVRRDTGTGAQQAARTAAAPGGTEATGRDAAR